MKKLMNLHKGNVKQTVREFAHKPQYNYDEHSKVDSASIDRLRTRKETVRVVNCGSLLTRCVQSDYVNSRNRILSHGYPPHYGRFFYELNKDY